jgi:hypothetical protein
VGVRTVSIDDVLTAEDLVGVLTRDVRVRLVNLSVSGCLVETTTKLEEGSAGSLRVHINSDTYADDVRIVRVQQVHGSSSTWLVGAEFLWTTQPGLRSLRRVVARLRQVLARQSVEFEFVARPN